MTEGLERTIIDLVATDRLYRPSSSFDGKLERQRPKMGKAIISYDDFDKSFGFEGERAYARLERKNEKKARGMKEGIKAFSKAHPKYGQILDDLIQEKREKSEKHLYFGMHEGTRVSNQDYMNVLLKMGLTEITAQKYYEVAIDISRTLQKKKDDDEKRSVLVKA